MKLLYSGCRDTLKVSMTLKLYFAASGVAMALNSSTRALFVLSLYSPGTCFSSTPVVVTHKIRLHQCAAHYVIDISWVSPCKLYTAYCIMTLTSCYRPDIPDVTYRTATAPHPDRYPHSASSHAIPHSAIGCRKASDVNSP
jgi:hypothetical protein